MHAVALANTPACNSHRTGMRWPSHPIVFFRAVLLHLPSQYIFICLCSISVLSLAVLLFKETDIMLKYYRTAIVVYINTDAVRYRMLYLLLLFFIPYLRHGECCLFTIVPAIGMAGYQCLMPVASFICWNIIGILWFEQSDNGTRMTQIRWMTAKKKFFWLLCSSV